MAIQGETKECLMCHMQIQALAKVCPYCRLQFGIRHVLEGGGSGEGASHWCRARDRFCNHCD